jgi:hypothetical protein
MPSSFQVPFVLSFSHCWYFGVAQEQQVEPRPLPAQLHLSTIRSARLFLVLSSLCDNCYGLIFSSCCFLSHDCIISASFYCTRLMITPFYAIWLQLIVAPQHCRLSSSSPLQKKVRRPSRLRGFQNPKYNIKKNISALFVGNST